ncbi:MAG TPA: hypothetical protein VHB25_20780 [Gemmatimonadaceae bacterium]|nr:hypothetical protein [Gemmatimonadaceae bacterium]
MPTLRRTAVLLLSLTAACGGKSTARTDSSPPKDGRDTSRAPTYVTDPGRLKITVVSAVRDATAAAHPVTPAQWGGNLGGPDSAIRIQQATQPKSRTKADSISLVAEVRAGLKDARWPMDTPAPLPGAILPGKRIVAFYGNPLSKRMGILGEIPYDQMLAKLDTVVGWWRKADPTHPVQPALHLIVSVAQGLPGKDGMYRQRSDPDLIEKIYGMAHARGYITILDIQAGKSTIDSELPVLLPFLQRPDVHLGMDPEFYMHYNREGRAPGTKIGSMDAKDVNYAIDQLAALVTKYHLPPKVLIVHRFTTNMLQHSEQIKLDPRVQVVINMDGWGQPWLKFDTYARCEEAEPVQYTGFKLFFHNDTKKGDALLSPLEVLALRPRPLYIQYQ